MKNKNEFLESLEHAFKLEKKYDVPAIDILLISLNIEGVNYPFLDSKRVRFKISPYLINEDFYLALTNTKDSRWIHNGKKLLFKNKPIAKAELVENDTCDSTYFRKFVNIKNHKIGTEMTINSNNRRKCSGCKFCGTYKLNSAKGDEDDLTSPQRLRKRINYVLANEKLEDLSHVKGISIVTGCFENEKDTLEHILMLNDILKNDYNFKGELKYMGSQITSIKSLKKMAEYVNSATIAMTIECFTRRNQMLKPEKNISLDKSRKILNTAKDLGINTTILYIMGLDPLEIFSDEIKKYVPVLTEFPIINTMQEYIPGQADLRHLSANRIEYYLNARKMLEDIFKDKNLKPKVWQDYRGLFFTEYGGKKLNGIKI